MPLKMGEKKPFVTQIPEGSYGAVCVGIYDLGTQKTNFNGKESLKEQIMIVWEIPELRDSEGQPVTINRKYTQSLDKKSNLCKDLTSWSGRLVFDSDGQFDIRQFLGRPCNLMIIHSEDGMGSVWANVQSVSGWPKGAAPPKAKRRPTSFDFSDGKADLDPEVPEFAAKLIMNSPEWNSLILGETDGPTNGEAVSTQATQVNLQPSNHATPDAPPRAIVKDLKYLGLEWPFGQHELERALESSDMTPDEQKETFNLLAPFSIPF